MTRFFARSAVAAAATLAFAVPAFAGEVPTVAEHLCTFAGKCDGLKIDSDGPETGAGKTRGFRLAKAPAEQSATSKQPTRGSRARPATAYTTSSRETGPVGRRAATGGQRRGDLRIGFALGSAEMTPVGVSAARNFAQAIQLPELAGARFAIEGHTDSLGTPETNRELSRRRAQSVADFLVAQGVERERLEVQGFGSRQPIAGTAARNPVNRRVEALRLR